MSPPQQSDRGQRRLLEPVLFTDKIRDAVAETVHVDTGLAKGDVVGGRHSVRSQRQVLRVVDRGLFAREAEPEQLEASAARPPAQNRGGGLAWDETISIVRGQQTSLTEIVGDRRRSQVAVDAGHHHVRYIPRGQQPAGMVEGDMSRRASVRYDAGLAVWCDLDDLADASHQGRTVAHRAAGPALFRETEQQRCLATRLGRAFIGFDDGPCRQVGETFFADPVARQGYWRASQPAFGRAKETSLLEAVQPRPHGGASGWGVEPDRCHHANRDDVEDGAHAASEPSSRNGMPNFLT